MIYLRMCLTCKYGQIVKVRKLVNYPSVNPIIENEEVYCGRDGTVIDMSGKQILECNRYKQVKTKKT